MVNKLQFLVIRMEEYYCHCKIQMYEYCWFGKPNGGFY